MVVDARIDVAHIGLRDADLAVLLTNLAKLREQAAEMYKAISATSVSNVVAPPE